MLKNLSAGWFTKAPTREPFKRIKLEPELRTLLDKNVHREPELELQSVLDKHILRGPYSSLLKQMETLTMRKHQAVLVEVKQHIAHGNTQQAAESWRKITNGFGNGYYPSFEEFYRKHPQKEWNNANEVLKMLSSLEPNAAAQFFTPKGFLNALVVGKVLEDMSRESGLAYIREFGKQSKRTNHYVALNIAANKWLRQHGVTLSSLEALFQVLPQGFRLSLYQYNAVQLSSSHRRQMLDIWDLLYEKNAKLNTPGMSSFLRALFSSSDVGYEQVLQGLYTREYSLGFYHYLINVLCRRKEDPQVIDWIFEHKLDKSRPHLILYSLLVRTLTYDGFEDAKPVLEAMGDNVPEQSWRAIFKEFRKRGEVEKAFDALRRAVTVFGMKLSFPLANDYLLLVSQNYKAEVFFQALFKVFPNCKKELEPFKLLPDPIVAAEPSFTLSEENLNFQHKQLHESTLAIIYQVVLNQEFDVDTIMSFYRIYQGQMGTRKVTLGVVDVFIKALLQIRTPEAVLSAQQLYISALESLPLRKPLTAYFGNASLLALVSNLCKAGNTHAAIKLIDLTANHPHAPFHGKALRSLFIESGGSETFKKWALKNGALLEEDEN